MIHQRSGPKRTPHDSRTLPVIGEGADKGKYYRCWNCGFICDKERDYLGDGTGVTAKEALPASSDGRCSLRTNRTLPASPAGTASSSILATLPVLEGPDFVGTVGGSTSVPQNIRYTFEPNVSSGCPFCGSTNWKKQ